MKCYFCEGEARAVCKFCGRFVCRDHVQEAHFYSGYGKKRRDGLWPSGSETGVHVADAVYCGSCKIKYERTF